MESTAGTDSTRLLAEFKHAQGASVMFPPISEREANERHRSYTMNKDLSRKQIAPIPEQHMRALKASPSQILQELDSAPSTSHKREPSEIKSPVRDREHM